MPSIKDRRSEVHKHEEVGSINESGSEGSEGSEGTEETEDTEETDEDGSEVNIDLSENDFYKGMCTLLEDENGNNIIKYIELLCDQTKEVADNVKHLESIRVDIHRIAKSFERFVSIQEQQFMTKQSGQMTGSSQQVMPPPVPKKEHHDYVTVKSVKKSSSTTDDSTVKSSKTQKSSKQ